MTSALRLREHTGAREPYFTCQVDGLTLSYNDEGQGPPVVCLHAIGHGAADFAAFSRRLADRYRVIALDWPGQGRSTDDRVPPSAVRYAAILRDFLDALALDRVVLVGNSIGGAAALRLAADSPDRVSALILENPAGLEPQDPLLHAATSAMATFFSAASTGARWHRLVFQGYYRLVLPSAPAHQQRARIVAAGAELAPLLAQAWRGFARRQGDLSMLGPAIRCPTLFAWAMRDFFVHLHRSRAAIARFPYARLQKFSAGHCPHLETPDEFAAAVVSFLCEIH
jgi:4,5:9,10-diseco-3-hydroxy-5,9,17-trioxoandrosta-1(10),2-diene-4-oate hydrolase